MTVGVMILFPVVGTFVKFAVIVPAGFETWKMLVVERSNDTVPVAPADGAIFSVTEERVYLPSICAAPVKLLVVNVPPTRMFVAKLPTFSVPVRAVVSKL